ncbi:VPS35 endosomal protein sorting factor-like [Pollicipes pollicipes]|uniref:VPS35 endosomal protein sorting factor-like n=1 Tax=Pollicipes pollicipes TaxID=41117 RepID=UPI001884C38B|nr:VPS35 endosomal protein sorting factor-like [Pollicipes pollicipes]
MRVAIIAGPAVQGPLYLVRGLLAALDRMSWLQGTDELAALMIDFLRLLSALSQPEYLYSVPGVDSNDTLYGGDSQLTAEIGSLADDVITRVTSHLKLGSQSTLNRAQVVLASELCLTLLRCGGLAQRRVRDTARPAVHSLLRLRRRRRPSPSLL